MRQRLTVYSCIGLVLLLLSGCSFLHIQNLSEVDVRVLVRVPDQGGRSTRAIAAGGTAVSFSNYGGSYMVTTLPNEEYRQLLLDLREQIGTRLFEERQTLSAADVTRLVALMQNLTGRLDELGQEGDSCRGNLPDFETVTAVLTWDELNGKWLLTCP